MALHERHSQTTVNLCKINLCVCDNIHCSGFIALFDTCAFAMQQFFKNYLPFCGHNSNGKLVKVLSQKSKPLGRLNRLIRIAGVGLFLSTLHKWSLVPSANCSCGAEEQTGETADHIISSCPTPSFKRDTKFGGSRRWRCGLASKNSNQHLMIQNQPKRRRKRKLTLWLEDSFCFDHIHPPTKKSFTKF